MKTLLLIATLAACTHKPAETPAPKDTRTPYQIRRDAACKTLGPKITACALADIKAALAAGTVSKKVFDEATAKETLDKNTNAAIESCEKIQTTFQLRVIEVCQEKETECEPMTTCLDHVNDPPAAK